MSSSHSNSRSARDGPPINIVAAAEISSTSDDDYSFRGSTTGSGSNEQNRYSYVGNESLARILLISRILIMALLMGMAIGCTFVTFLFTKQVEVGNFERLVSSISSDSFPLGAFFPSALALFLLIHFPSPISHLL